MRRFSRAFIPFLVGVITLLSGTDAYAQRTGSITGRVLDAATRRPLQSAQVSIVGTRMGTLAGQDGNFVILGVPAGTHTVRVEFLGFGVIEQSVQVSVGQEAQLAFELTARALSLDEIIVTGAGPATTRRRLGNTVASVGVQELVRQAPIQSVDQLLQGRVSGMQIQLPGGTIGTQGIIRVRGTKSVSLTGNPVLYIDGVRVDGGANSDLGLSGQDISRMIDLRPQDIERIEVVKGAAAATLYGTQGSNGVIQIFTKRGRTGAPQWEMEVTQGFNRLPGDFPGDTFPGRLWTQFTGPGGYRAHDPKELIENGYLQNYNLSVSGGTQDVTYYISGGFKKEYGSFVKETNLNQQFSTRVNLQALISPKVTLAVRSGLVSNRARLPENDNGLHGIYSQVVSGIPFTADSTRPYGERWGSWSYNSTLENTQNVLRNTTGVSLDFRPSETFSNRVNVGIDWYRQESLKFFPFAYKGSGNALGNKTNVQRYFRDLTLDYQGTLSWQMGGAAQADLTVGAQGNFGNTIVTRAFGTDFPGPGVKTVGAAAITTGGETRVEEVNAGIFAQQTIGLWDRVFITAGVRADGNSAFGNDFDYQFYPKASIAYNISEAEFWPDAIPTMKLRFAYGSSGLAPAQFAADRTFNPISAEEGQPAVTPGNIGNAELGPERSQELEFGFDAGLLGERVGLEFTLFRQATKDALLRQQAPPTNGFVSPQLTNIGEVRNRGFELGARALLVRRGEFEMSGSLQYTRQHNEVTDLGGLPPFSAGGNTRITEGFPVQGKWGYVMAGWDANRRTHSRTDSLVYLGSTDPVWFGSLGADIRYRAFSIRLAGDYAGGHVQHNYSRWWSIRNRTGDDYLTLVEKPTGTPTAASDSLLDLANVVGSTDHMFMSPADYLSIREISLSLALPESLLARFGMSRSTLTLGVRNLKEFTRYEGISPQTNWDGANDIGRGQDFNTMAPLRTFMLTFRTTF